MGRVSLFSLLSILVLFSCLSLSATHRIHPDESALLAFKSLVTLDPSNTLKTNWTTGVSVCSWIGVTCDSHYHRVTHLDLHYMNLTGSIPPEFGNLSFLVYLDLSGNSLHGPLPKEIFSHNNLPRLKELHLSSNRLEGEIPLSLCECSQLEILDLSDNYISGHVPTQIGNMTRLRELNLQSNNNISGKILHLYRKYNLFDPLTILFLLDIDDETT